jgi:L-fucose mutarotase/ribose pyranase (RbsD/FucU family)
MWKPYGGYEVDFLMNRGTMNQERMIKSMARVFVFAAAITCLLGCQNTAWRAQLKKNLPELGHRNWIVVADSAYPRQNSSGIKTMVTGCDQLDVLETVLKAIEETPHVRAIVQMDQELAYVSEADAPGVTAYRERLKTMLKHKTVQVKPHGTIIADLDEASQMFNILLLKTTMTVPYTSVFFQLDCAYWSADQENRLRQALEKAVR